MLSLESLLKSKNIRQSPTEQNTKGLSLLRCYYYPPSFALQMPKTGCLINYTKLISYWEKLRKTNPQREIRSMHSPSLLSWFLQVIMGLVRQDSLGLSKMAPDRQFSKLDDGFFSLKAGVFFSR